MNEKTKRNHEAKFYVNSRLAVAKTKNQVDFPEYNESTDIYQIITDLIEVKTKGFRGVVVTALTGMHLDEQFNPLISFYSCNPRAIFEQGIWYALQENNIPCGKSDPLNVAKNINLLNEDWANGKRPQSAAIAAVKFLEKIIEADNTTRANLIDYFFFRLNRYSESIAKYEIKNIKSSISCLHLGNLLTQFTLKYPESGILPQYLVSQLLTLLFSNSNVEVIGGDESVFGTNTTSKKPADIWLKDNGVETNLYEVTVKPVTKKRLDDCLDALQLTGYLDFPITFICRIPQDVSELEVSNGVFMYKQKPFNFIDYESFCSTLYILLKDRNLQLLLDNVAALIKGVNISITTKKGWNEFFLKEIY